MSQTQCPRCHHEFEPAAAIVMKSLTDRFEHHLSPKARAAYAIHVDKLDGIVYLGARIEQTSVRDLVDPTEFDVLVERALLRMAYVYNRGIEEGWLQSGVFMRAASFPLASWNLTRQEIVLLYVCSDKSQEELNALFGGLKLFVQEGEVPQGAVTWDAFAEATM